MNNLDHENKRNDQKIYQGLFGIEIEQHRFDLKHNSLSRYKHAVDLGNRQTQPFFQNDFTESMEELVTLPYNSINKVIENLHSLRAILMSDLKSDEIIWPLSMPPKLDYSDLAFIKSTTKNRPWYQAYLDMISKKYGLYQQLIAGVHLNYSLADDIVTDFMQKKDYVSKKNAQNELLFRVGQQIVGYRWLITYLFGATPVSENKNDTIPKEIKAKEPFRSIRSSQYGYRNLSNVKVSYTSLHNFVNDITELIKNKKLSGISEFYGPVRLKGFKHITDIYKKGAKYVEFRIFDDNPFSVNGISKLQLNFVHLLIIDELKNYNKWESNELKQAEIDNDAVSLQHPKTILTKSLQDKASELFNRLDIIVKTAPLNLQDELLKALKYAKSALKNPDKTLAGKLVLYIKNNSLEDFGIKTGIKYKNDFANETEKQKFPEVMTSDIHKYINDHKKGIISDYN